jgi:hypothetical protein
MNRLFHVAIAVPALFCAAGMLGAENTPLDIRLTLPPTNPKHPVMGDHLRFHSVIRNTGSRPVEGLTAWINLVEVDPGHEQPMDLEDWSAHKAVTHAVLAPGRALDADWPMRLIQAGVYRVVICAAFRDRQAVYTSPAVEFRVKQKPVVESSRILPIAFGIPFLLGCFMVLRRPWGQAFLMSVGEIFLLFVALLHVVRFHFSDRFIMQ